MDTCPSPEIADSRKRPLDGDNENGDTKRSHFSTGNVNISTLSCGGGLTKCYLYTEWVVCLCKCQFIRPSYRDHDRDDMMKCRAANNKYLSYSYVYYCIVVSVSVCGAVNARFTLRCRCQWLLLLLCVCLSLQLHSSTSWTAPVLYLNNGVSGSVRHRTYRKQAACRLSHTHTHRIEGTRMHGYTRSTNVLLRRYVLYT